MSWLYLDIFVGISGDMFLGALSVFFLLPTLSPNLASSPLQSSPAHQSRVPLHNLPHQPCSFRIPGIPLRITKRPYPHRRVGLRLTAPLVLLFSGLALDPSLGA